MNVAPRPEHSGADDFATRGGDDDLGARLRVVLGAEAVVDRDAGGVGPASGEDTADLDSGQEQDAAVA
jgi:hypothetical protein